MPFISIDRATETLASHFVTLFLYHWSTPVTICLFSTQPTLSIYPKRYTSTHLFTIVTFFFTCLRFHCFVTFESLSFLLLLNQFSSFSTSFFNFSLFILHSFFLLLFFISSLLFILFLFFFCLWNS